MIRKRLKALFLRPQRKLVAILPQLRQLREGLTRVGYEMGQDPLGQIVHFFNLTSPWHDRGLGDIIAAFEGVNYGQFGNLLVELRMLQTHFEQAGRNLYGMNRTERGERVTVEKVFLGNIYGLFKRPIPHWQEASARVPDKRFHWRASAATNGMSDHDVVARQARQFMGSHVQPMIEYIVRIENAHF